MKTVCLTMIVKNEMKVLKRCFDSVSPYIDYWVISDTGSTDGTQEFIKNYFKEKNIPGELHDDPWVNFGHNRSLAVKEAYKKADYLLLMDADFTFKIKDPDFKKNLDKDGYYIKYDGGLDYRQMLFVSGHKKWRYVGVTHEYITCDGPKTQGSLDGFTFYHLADGGNRTDKFERDIRLLKQGLKDEPNNVRYAFYLAQSYKDISDCDNAIIYYKQRVKMGGWAEEVYQSLLHIGLCRIKRGDPFDEYKHDLLAAYNYRPSRLEALYYLVSNCRFDKKYKLGLSYGIPAINTPYPKNDLLFIDKAIHEWKFLDEVALCAFYSQEFLLALKIYKILESRGVPAHLKESFSKNTETFKTAYLNQIQRQQYEHRVAIIIMNHNNKNSTDNIVNYITKNVKQPHDLIVVDNGSKSDEISDSTTIKLAKNIYNTNGWLLGLNYSDTIAMLGEFKYYAYVFINANMEVVSTDKDIVTDMVNILKNNNNVVGVHPKVLDLNNDELPEKFRSFSSLAELTKDKLTTTNSIDNICSCYLASWFNIVGRFSSELLYEMGVPTELGYLSKLHDKNLCISLDMEVKLNTPINYYVDKSIKNAEEYFKTKYGDVIWECN